MRTLTRRIALLGAIVLSVTLLPAPMAMAAGYGCDASGNCTGTITNPGYDGGGQNDLSGPISIPLVPGPTACHHPEDATVEIPCQTVEGWWNAERRCYVKLDDPQPAPPAGSNGAYYRCTHLPPLSDPDFYLASYRYFSETPPPGIDRLSPWQVARILISSFQLEPITIGMAPDDGWKTYVGYQVWMWAADQQPLNYGPYSESLSLGGQTITATATVVSVVWDMGDGNTVLCGAGTAYNPDVHGANASPTCGYSYTQASPEGAPYTVSARSTWAVYWTSATGESGTIILSRSTSRLVEVGELQAVNVPNP